MQYKGKQLYLCRGTFTMTDTTTPGSVAFKELWLDPTNSAAGPVVPDQSDPFQQLQPDDYLIHRVTARINGSPTSTARFTAMSVYACDTRPPYSPTQSQAYARQRMLCRLDLGPVVQGAVQAESMFNDPIPVPGPSGIGIQVAADNSVTPWIQTVNFEFTVTKA